MFFYGNGRTCGYFLFLPGSTAILHYDIVYFWLQDWSIVHNCVHLYLIYS